ncbi:uncharacterized protein LOC119179921 isoform X2 [Rhipicephalus microplus]|uniref:uncharacterized protein LOC119179921 isoform X2 n=1 Tax=Rhipicephalus microplus TaxID=6941 RepID=UPI003F6BC9E3
MVLLFSWTKIFVVMACPLVQVDISNAQTSCFQPTLRTPAGIIHVGCRSICTGPPSGVKVDFNKKKCCGLAGHGNKPSDGPPCSGSWVNEQCSFLCGRHGQSDFLEERGDSIEGALYRAHNGREVPPWPFNLQCQIVFLQRARRGVVIFNAHRGRQPRKPQVEQKEALDRRLQNASCHWLWITACASNSKSESQSCQTGTDEGMEAAHDAECVHSTLYGYMRQAVTGTLHIKLDKEGHFAVAPGLLPGRDDVHDRVCCVSVAPEVRLLLWYKILCPCNTVSASQCYGTPELAGSRDRSS